ncbi:MAG: hypothetical protein ABEJ56_01525 [Candidatus Nanohaloarchaea archaeon]
MTREIEKIAGILSRPLYFSIAAISTITSFMFFSLSTNSSAIFIYFRKGNFTLLSKLIPDLINGFILSSSLISLILTLITSVLIGLNIVLAAFRLVNASQLNKSDIGSIPGILTSIVAPACPACATTFLAFAGFTSLYALLPFNGILFKVVGILLLSGSALYTFTQIDRERCKL